MQYDKEVAEEKYKDISEEELEKIIWEQIKEINKEIPTYKYFKHIILTKVDFIKTTTENIISLKEIKKISEE